MTIASSPSTTLDRLIDFFVPAGFEADRETRRRVRMFLLSHILGPFLGNSVPLVLYVADPNPGFEVAVLAASISVFWLFPVALRSGASYDRLVLLSVWNLSFCILWSCYFYGGVRSPTLVWVLTIPLLAFFYIGPESRSAHKVTAVFVSNIAAYFLIHLVAPEPAHELPESATLGLGIVSIAAAALYVGMMAVYYARILADGVDLENEMRRHLETAAELRRAAAEARRAGAAKADFLAKMSHELRTPLNAVIGYSEILLDDAEAEGDQDTARDLGKIRGAGKHLLRLINEVLDLSKIEAGRMEVFVEAAEPAAIVREAADEVREAAQARGNVLHVHAAEDLGTMLCDADKVRQALGHLLDNAAKFTENGMIVVAAERIGDEVMFSVDDTGIGIAPEIAPGLFETFTVADDSSGSKYGGTGLGLALARKLCRLLGGDVSLEPRDGPGSRFVMRIPTHPVHAAEATPVQDCETVHKQAA